MPQIEPVSTEPCLLGEGPVWDDRSGCVFWVDIKNPAIHSLHLASGVRRRWPMPARIGAIGMMNDTAAFVGAFEDGFAFIDLDKNAVTPIVRSGSQHLQQPLQRWKSRSEGEVLGRNDGRPRIGVERTSLLSRHGSFGAEIRAWVHGDEWHRVEQRRPHCLYRGFIAAEDFRL